MRKQLIVLFSVSALACLAGCAAQQISHVNNDLERNYALRKDLLKKIDGVEGIGPADGDAIDVQARLAAVESNFVAIMTESLKAAEATADPRVQVSHYRTAATAAWQAGKPETFRKVDEISEKGSALCRSRNLSTGPEGAPRDCAMLAVIPFLALNDEVVVRAMPLMRDIDRRATVTPEESGKMEGFVQSFLKAADLAGDARGSLNANALDEAFLRAIDARRTKIACNAFRVRTALHAVVPDPRSSPELGRIDVALAQKNVSGKGCDSRFSRS